jgi:hypothetical protein
MAKSKTVQQTIATDGSAADVQSKINSAQSGDTVTIPSGSFSWSTQVTINKAITLAGEAGAKLSIQNGISAININAPATGLVRLTALEISVQTPEHYNGTIEASSAPGETGFRIDHCTFTTRNGGAMYLRTKGNGPGLIDHCTFGGGQEMVHNEGVGTGNTAGWNDDCTPGDPNHVYFEDCEWTHYNLSASGFQGCSAIQNYYCARTVVRHCTLNYCQIDVHGTPGMVGGRWFEFYNNTFKMPSNGNQDKYYQIRAGSGVIWGNKFQGGPNKGAGNIALYEEDTGSYPLDFQVGRGRGQKQSPAYLWDNAPELHVAAYSGVTLGRDVFNSASQPASMRRAQLSSDGNGIDYSYVPCVYPHPLASGDQPIPPDPIPPEPPIPSTKFKVGDSVCPSPNTANVRETAAGNLLGTQAAGTVGQVTGGPDWGQLPTAPSGVYWWNVNFPQPPSGFIGEDNLILAQAPPEPPDVGAEYSQWLDKWAGWIAANPPTGSAPYTDWLDEMAGWIDQNPPVPD